MRIFITGATGILGKRVLPLLSAKHAVTALSRSAENQEIIEKAGAVPAFGDLFNPKFIEYTTEDMDVIIHLATKIPRKPNPKLKDWAENDMIRTAGTKNLLKAAKVNAVKYYIQESVTLLYGNQNGREITAETTFPKKQIRMLNSAAVMEEIVRKSADSDLKYIIMRLGTLYAPDAFHTQNIFDTVRKGKMPIIGKGDFYWNMIHADDAAAAVEHVVDHISEYQNKILNVTDCHPIQYKDILAAIAERTESKAPYRVPHWLTRFILDKDTYKYLTSSFRVTKNDLKGWQPKYATFQEGIRNIS